mgnify:CR=1 FL=1
MTSEFAISKFLNAGANDIRVLVFKWSDGSYLEDQDMWRMTGFARESYIYARDKRHIKGTVKDHKVIRNVETTVLTRCALVK